MPRGRLIFPFMVDLARLNTESTQVDTVFREPIKLPDLTTPGSPGTTSGVVELPIIQLLCQIEDGDYEAINQFPSGDSPESKLVLVFHYQDLETAGLVEANGEPPVRVNDRIVAFRNRYGVFIRDVRTPPGLYATEVKDGGFGLGTFRNLLIVTFNARERAQ